MLEGLNLSSSSTKGVLINCDNGISEEASKTLSFESNGRDISLEGVVKYKRRKVSTNRDFPKGCGRYALRIKVKPTEDGVNIGSVKNSKVRKDGSLNELGSIKKSGSSVEPRTLEIGKYSDEIESVNLNQAEVFETTKNVVPMAMKISNVSEFCQVNYQRTFDPSELVDPFETISESKLPNLQNSLIFEMTNSLEVLNEAEVFEPPENVVPIAVEENTNGLDSMNLLRNVSLPEDEDLLNSSPLQSAIPSKVSMHSKYHPRRRISACRDSPQGCGRNAPRISKEECLKIVSRSKVKGDIEQITEKVRDGDVLECKMKGNITKETRDGVLAKVEAVVKEEKTEWIPIGEASKGKLGKESVKLNKNMSFKRKFLGEREDERNPINQSQVKESDNFVIVHGLMAAPNCPWRESKRAFTSPIGKEHELVEQENSTNVSEKNDAAENSEGKSKKKKMSYEDLDLLRDSYNSPGHDKGDGNYQLVQRSQDLDLILIPFGLHTSVDKDDNEAVATRNKVRETLRLFQGICRKLLRGEESKMKAQGKGSGRIDLMSARILKEKHKWVNTGKPILGSVPGVEVGDEFKYRVELAIIGLHHPFQGGIDYIRRNGTVLATSIVASGGYADEMDSSDVILYSGQGGNPSGKYKKAEDQKLERGNLALKNSMDERTPVRVIHGFKESKGSDSVDTREKIVVTYTYDGLYLVEKYWQEKGCHGTNVFMFKLRRIPGQPELALKEVKKSKKLRVREGLCVDDISQGKEKMPICAVNKIDDEKPPPFVYITNMIYPSWYNPIPPRGCECTDGCLDSVKCVCVVKNGGAIPFNHNGAIVEAKPLVYECGPSCRCPPSCHNRVSQHGIKFQLEVFKTESRGWGVRSLTSISSGSFICEYTGELLHDKEAEQRTGNDEYLFDIGHNYNDHDLWDGLSTLIPHDLRSNSCRETVEDGGFTIDAAQYGSIGRFINHSCSPNLYAQNVLYDHDDKRMPHIMLFAAENIPPLQELTYHYNYMLDQVHDSDGNIKKKDCYCGSLECTGRMY